MTLQLKNHQQQLLNYLMKQLQHQRTPIAVDGTGFSAYTSGGTVSHTIVVLSSVKGEFTAGETCTGVTSSNTVVPQFETFGAKAFEQKAFNQTKGISMAGSTVFTANTDLTSTFGEVKTLTGVISTVDPWLISW